MRLCLLLAVVVLAAGCHKPETKELRLGFFPNITHAQALVGTSDGTFQNELGDIPLKTQVFNAGPAAMMALLSGAIDAAYVGPGPAINAFLKSQGDLQVIAGAAEGGAALVTHGAKSAQELHGKKLAVPQRGNTQDISLRYWLMQNFMIPDKDVALVPVSNPEIMALFERGEIEGAWLPEPWLSRLVAAGGHILVDQRSLWPEGHFHTTLLVANRSALDRKHDAIVRLLRAHIELTRRWQSDPKAFAAATGAAFHRLTGKALPEAILRDAFRRLQPGLQPHPDQLQAAADQAQKVGYISGSADCTGLVDQNTFREADQAH
jgi:NitT/TauT family transport system substrate-binding protein